jgi:hypothetical protein
VGVGAAFDGLPVDDERLDATGDEADLFVVVPVFGDT